VEPISAPKNVSVLSSAYFDLRKCNKRSQLCIPTWTAV